ncbi:hypothetical protein P43SY_004705 [Pythium insidiosum]|uniref:Cation/H+ exchanger transmembrane domain-containing protein n=1 Tax=Pythium insidiosum TaxID=114742 RepID=A0AAD5LT13_PYTIN|nr:hypothetical protein P43SY_004705 [Pythium insidiosum]
MPRVWMVLVFSTLLLGCASAADAPGVFLDVDDVEKPTLSPVNGVMSPPPAVTSVVALLTDAQLEAIGVKVKSTAVPPAPVVTRGAALRPAPVDPENKDAQLLPPSTDAPVRASAAELSGSVAADVSIDHVEAHLQILQQLELSVARSLEQLQSPAPQANREDGAGGGGGKRLATNELSQLQLELLAVQKNLKHLAEGLSGTLQDLEVVEKDTEAKAKQLQEVLQQQREVQQEHFIEENGIQVVDYETGHIRNSSVRSSMERQKLEAAEKKVDPAVLHYDFELLGQIATLLGVSAIGGIVATYFHVPPNIGYLLGGALVGPSCLMVVRQYKEVETISLFGSIFLLFGHGAGYIPQAPDQHIKRYLVGGIAYILATVFLVALVSVYLGWSASFSEGLTIGVAVSFTTTAPLYELIRANQIQDTSYGRTLTAIIAVQDILMSFALGTPEWFSVESVGWIGVAALRSILSYGIVVGLAYALHLYVVPPLLHFLLAMEQVHHAPLVLLGVVSVCLFMALFTETIGLSLECGAFLAGLAFVNVSRDAQAAFTSIRVMENLFGSMFFACVGMILNPLFLVRNAVEILSMVVFIVVIKTLSMTVVMKTLFSQIAIEKALRASAGLCQIGELALIFIIKAHASRLVSRRIYLLFVAAIAVFLGCSSLLNRQIVLARRKNVFRLPTTSSDKSRARSDSTDSAAGDSTSTDRLLVERRVLGTRALSSSAMAMATHREE